MRAPDLPCVAPAYAELFAEGCFSQRPLVSGNDLRAAALDRGLFLPLFPRREYLEPLDRAGALSPVGFLQTNSALEMTWLHPDPEALVWREERNFEPWASYSWHPYRDDPTEVSERYSAWQLLYLEDALTGWRVRLSMRGFDPDAQRTANVIRQQQEAATARLRTLDEEWRPVVKLLVALQTRLWSYRRQRTTLLYEPGGGDRIDPVRRAAVDFEPLALLRRFGLSLDELAQLHLAFAETACRLDPLPRWYRLAEAAPRKVTDEFRGAALRARDFYDACFMLRGLYYLATEQWLPRANEVNDDRTVAEMKRRHLPRRHQPEPWQRSGLKQLLIAEGLYPHRIHFFGEGDTEAIVLERLLPFLGYDLPGSGMAVTNIRGVDQAERYAAIFRSATQVAARTVLIADHEGEIARALKRLRAEGLFPGDEDVLLWEKGGQPSDFEEANFTARELLAAIRAAARKRHPDAKLTLTVADLRRERAARTRPLRAPPALAKLALKLAEDQRYGAVRVNKKQLAAEFAERLVRDIKTAGHLAEAGKRRPLLARLWYWIVNQR